MCFDAAKVFLIMIGFLTSAGTSSGVTLTNDFRVPVLEGEGHAIREIAYGFLPFLGAGAPPNSSIEISTDSGDIPDGQTSFKVDGVPVSEPNAPWSLWAGISSLPVLPGRRRRRGVNREYNKDEASISRDRCGRRTERIWRRLAVAALILGFSLLFAASPAAAEDLIRIAVNDAPRASGSNFVDLIDNVLAQEGEFQDLASLTDYAVAIDYLGIGRAILVDAENNGTRITLSIPSTGFSRVFEGPTADNVENQVENFFERSGADVLSRFLEEVNGRSPLAVLDGNPRSTTALLARGAYDRFGLGAPRSRAGYEKDQIAEWGHFDLHAQINGGAIDVDGFDSFGVLDAALTLAGDFDPGVGLSFSLITQYRDLDGADVYDAGFELGVPVSLRVPSEKSPIRWVVTPFLQVAAGVAVDLAAGGLMLGGGVVSSVSYNMGAFELMMANELAYYGGIPIDDIGGYKFETELDRLMLRNGGKLTYHMQGGTFIESGVSMTNFVVSDAAVDVYGTPFVGLGVKFGGLGLRVGWESDLGEDYAAHIGKAEIAFGF